MRAIVLSYESLYSNMMIAHLLESGACEVTGIVASSCVIQGKSAVGSLLHVLKRAGPEFFVQKSLETVQYKALVMARHALGRPSQVPKLSELAVRHGIAVTDSADVNSTESVRWIRDREPDLLLSVYLNQRIGPELLALPALGCLNIHPALLPHNRGLFPYFWVLANGETETGVSVHFVEYNFDTGDVVAQERISVNPDDTIQSLSYRSALVGGPLLAQALRDVAAGTVQRVPQDAARASYHSWPTSEAYLRFRRAGRKFGSIRELLQYM